MQYLKIQNDGILDPRLISLMGGTTKSENQFKIGQFGTGLKYVLAYMLRNNIDFKIFVGEREVIIDHRTEVISNHEFRIIYIDNERASVTDKMGLDWEAWMIIRELWCNALDEGGALREIVTNPVGVAGKTTFYVQFLPDIQQVLDDWSKYFLEGVEPIYDGRDFTIYPGCESLRIYKHGVLIHEEKDKPGLFRYDIKGAVINELREYRGSVDYDLSRGLKEADKKVADYAISNMTEEHYEGTMDYAWSYNGSWSAGWSEAVGSAKLIHQKALDVLQARGVEVDRDAMVVVPKNLFINLTAKLPGVSALRASSKINEFYEVHIPALEEKIIQGLVLLEDCRYFISPELKFIHGVFGDKNVMARVDFDTKEVLVSEQMVNKPMFDIITMLIEENEHFNTGHEDCSRNFQQHFIDLFAKTLLEKHKIQI